MHHTIFPILTRENAEIAEHETNSKQPSTELPGNFSTYYLSTERVTWPKVADTQLYTQCSGLGVR